MEEKNHKNLIKVALVLGIFFFISTIIFSLTIYQIKEKENYLTVTGSTREKIISDTVKWKSQFSTQVLSNNLNIGYSKMNNDKKIVKEFLIENGIKEEQINISPVFVEEIYKPGNFDLKEKEYNLRQYVEVNSNDVYKITEISKNVQKIIDKGVFFSTLSLEYYYSKLSDLRINLISPAIEDAKKRAEQIVGVSNKKIKSIQSVNLGVVQVLSPNSVEVSDYGTYDTSAIEKEVMMTVKVVFVIK